MEQRLRGELLRLQHLGEGHHPHRTIQVARFGQRTSAVWRVDRGGKVFVGGQTRKFEVRGLLLGILVAAAPPFGRQSTEKRKDCQYLFVNEHGAFRRAILN